MRVSDGRRRSRCRLKSEQARSNACCGMRRWHRLLVLADKVGAAAEPRSRWLRGRVWVWQRWSRTTEPWRHGASNLCEHRWRWQWHQLRRRWALLQCRLEQRQCLCTWHCGPWWEAAEETHVSWRCMQLAGHGALAGRRGRVTCR